MNVLFGGGRKEEIRKDEAVKKKDEKVKKDVGTVKKSDTASVTSSKKSNATVKTSASAKTAEIPDLWDVFSQLSESDMGQIERLQPDGDPNVDVVRLAQLFQLNTLQLFVDQLLAAIKQQNANKGDLYRSLKNIIMVCAYYKSKERAEVIDKWVADHEKLSDDEIPHSNLNNFIGFLGTMRFMKDAEAVRSFFIKVGAIKVSSITGT